MTEQGDKPAEGEEDKVDYKAELEKLKGEHESLKKQKEEIQAEFMGEEYLEFLNVKSGKKEEKPAEKPAQTTEDEFEKLTKKQIYDKALADATKAAKSEVEADRNARTAEANEKIKTDVQKFASTHEDYEKYRPIMHGFSFDKKFEHTSLQELYDAAKSHVKALATGATDDQKDRSRKSSNEKPGSSSPSFRKDKGKLSADEAAEEAWEEVVGKEGLPTR